MPYSSTGYRSRAEECVRLANQTKDTMLQSAILSLRQQYLEIARRLSEIDQLPAQVRVKGERPESKQPAI